MLIYCNLIGRVNACIMVLFFVFFSNINSRMEISFGFMHNLICVLYDKKKYRDISIRSIFISVMFLLQISQFERFEYVLQFKKKNFKRQNDSNQTLYNNETHQYGDTQSSTIDICLYKLSRFILWLCKNCEYIKLIQSNIRY